VFGGSIWSQTRDTVGVDVACVVGIRISAVPAVDDGSRGVGLDGVFILLDLDVILCTDIPYWTRGPRMHILHVVFVQDFFVNDGRVLALLAEFTLQHGQLYGE
jgi:hypothetical protein